MKRRTLFLAIMGALGAPTAEPKPQGAALPAWPQRQWAGNGEEVMMDPITGEVSRYTTMDWAAYGLESAAGPLMTPLALVYSDRGGFDAIGYSEARRQSDGTFKVTRQWTVKRPGVTW
jgi:hypothetical protein